MTILIDLVKPPITSLSSVTTKQCESIAYFEFRWYLSVNLSLRNYIELQPALPRLQLNALNMSLDMYIVQRKYAPDMHSGVHRMDLHYTLSHKTQPSGMVLRTSIIYQNSRTAFKYL